MREKEDYQDLNLGESRLCYDYEGGGIYRDISQMGFSLIFKQYYVKGDLEERRWKLYRLEIIPRWKYVNSLMLGTAGSKLIGGGGVEN